MWVQYSLKMIILIDNRWDERGEICPNEENMNDTHCIDPPAVETVCVSPH